MDSLSTNTTLIQGKSGFKFLALPFVLLSTDMAYPGLSTLSQRSSNTTRIRLGKCLMGVVTISELVLMAPYF
jgi:hypothetical protein